MSYSKSQIAHRIYVKIPNRQTHTHVTILLQYSSEKLKLLVCTQRNLESSLLPESVLRIIVDLNSLGHLQRLLCIFRMPIITQPVHSFNRIDVLSKGQQWACNFTISIVYVVFNLNEKSHSDFPCYKPITIHFKNRFTKKKQLPVHHER